MRGWRAWGWLGLLVGLSVLAASRSEASVAVQKSDGTYLCEATTLRGGDTCADGSTALLATESYEKRIELDITDFVLFNDTAGTVSALTADTDPRLTKDTKSAGAFILWFPGVTHNVQARFRIPDDYLSGGAFRVTLGREGGTGTVPEIDFEVFVDKDLTAFDTAATNQTAVPVVEVQGGSRIQKTLTVTTDFASLVAKDVVTLNLWRVSGGQENLELAYAEFFYTARD